ncbi:MAG: AraC family transcriptional regulator [Peptococcaceae bacterium]
MIFDYTINFNLDTDWLMQKHDFHENYEVLFSLSNAGKCFVGSNTYPLERGTIMIIKDAVLHRTIANECTDYQRYVLYISKETLKSISTPQTDLLSRFSTLNQCSKIQEMDIPKVIRLFKSCYTPQNAGFGDDLRKGIAFIELLLTISELIDDQNPSEALMNFDFIKVSPIIEYIQNNLAEELSLDSLAKNFFMSKYYMCHIFKSSTGFSVGEFIISNRVLLARSLLREGCSVQEAGEKSGFKNNSHFIHTFGKLSGKSPGLYRKEYLMSSKK